MPSETMDKPIYKDVINDKPPINEVYARGISEMGTRGPQVSVMEWLDALAHMFSSGLGMRGGVGEPSGMSWLKGGKGDVPQGFPGTRNPMIKFPIMKSKYGDYPVKGDLKFIAGESADIQGYSALLSNKPKRLDTRTSVLGRARPSDTFKPGRGPIYQGGDPSGEWAYMSNQPEDVRKLLDVLTSPYIIQRNTGPFPQGHLPW